MSSKRYLQINKYFAFVFMVFAVMTGVTDDYNEANVASSQSNGYTYFLRATHLLSKDTNRARVQILAKRYNVFSAYIQHLLAVKGATDGLYLSFAIGILVFILFYINNQIRQNNIWRETIF